MEDMLKILKGLLLFIKILTKDGNQDFQVLRLKTRMPFTTHK
jgi:hypothetical protein